MYTHPILDKDFKSLSEDEIIVLGYFAYLGSKANHYDLGDLAVKTKKTSKSLKSAYQNLCKKEYLLDYSQWYWSSYVPEIKKEIQIPVLFFIFNYHPDLVPVYKTFKYIPNYAEFFVEVVSAIVDGSTRKLYSLRANPHWPYGEYCYEYLKHYIDRPEYSILFSLLPLKDFVDTFADAVDNVLNQPNVKDEFDCIEKHVETYVKYNVLNPDPFLDRINAYRFFYWGKCKAWKSDTSMWHLAVDAIKALFVGDLDSAGALFAAALKIHNQDSSDKNIFYSPILSFYLMLYYAKVGTDDARKKVKIFLNKQYVQTSAYFIPIKIIGQYLVMNVDTRGLIPDVAQYFKHCHVLPYEAGMTRLLVEYFSLDPAKCGSDEIISKAVPCQAILRYELSAFADMPDKDELQESFKGAPVLASLRKKQEWEKAIEDALFSIGSTKTEQKQARIVYIISHDGSVSLKEQKKLKNGLWGVGAHVSFATFVAGTKQSMDETDRKVAAAIAPNVNYGYVINVGAVLAPLVGSDRVFYDNKGTLKPVTVDEEKVYICIEESSKGFTVSTNLPKIHTSGVYIKKTDPQHYIVYRISPLEMNILAALTSIKYYPKEAKSSFMEIISRLDGKVEIHSSLIKGGSTLDKVKGISAIALLLSPEDDGYILSIFARPLEGGSLKLTPGKGANPVYDSIDGKRYQIERDLDKEKKLYKEIMLFLTESTSAYGLEQESAYALNPQDTLELLDYVKDRGDDYYVEWPKGQEIKIKSRISTSSVSVSLKRRQNWFEMEGDVKIDAKTVMTVQQLLQLFAQGNKGRFIKLSDGDFIALSEALRKQLRSIDDLSTAGVGRVPVYQIGGLADIVNGKESILSAGKDFKSLEKKMEAAGKIDPKVPSALQAELRDYQKEGFQWMTRLSEWGAGACLADDMGLGKTVQAIAFLLYRASLGPSLVVAPASVVLNWASELSRFAPSLNVMILNESSERKDVIERTNAGCVVLCSYALLVRQEVELTAKQWNVVCLDEAHTIKNRGTKMSIAAMKLVSQSRLILTGTPVQNHLGELWNLFQFLNPGLLGTLEKFNDRYISGAYAAENARRLKKVIQPFILRRRKSDVIEELPDKTEILRLISLSEEEMAFYESKREEAEEALESSEKVDINALSYITRLRQMSCSMGLVEKAWPKVSSKTDAAVSLIHQIVEGGNRVLVFSQFTSYLMMVKEALGMDDIFYLDGSVPIRKREEMVSKFQSGEGSVFFISLKAGGLGLNLTGANYVIHLDPWWNPAIEQQATDRAYRIGQQQNVTVYHLISAHTIEEKILRLHKTKKDMADAILEGTDVSRSLSLEELRDLVSGK